MEFELGQTYSGYQFLDVVRRSRSAVQYRVQNTLAQREESFWTLTAADGEDPDAAERFLREVRIRARLSHPHIVRFYTTVPIEGRMGMTTEPPESLSLAERMKLGPLPWREALDITRQLLEALGCIHQQSFVHCGIAPENILFGPGVFCKLADFSLARPLDSPHNSESGDVVGNPRYISPEQVKGERQIDPRSDLYSVGVVLYEMLCGRPPFESRSQFELMMAHVNQAPVPPSCRQAKVPQVLDAIVMKALAKETGDRYPSAAAFAADIAEVASRESVEAEPVPAAPFVPEELLFAETVAIQEAVIVSAEAMAPAELPPVVVAELEVSTGPPPAIAEVVEDPGAVNVPAAAAIVATPSSDVVAEFEVSTESAAEIMSVPVPEAVPVPTTEAVLETGDVRSLETIAGIAFACQTIISQVLIAEADAPVSAIVLEITGSAEAPAMAEAVTVATPEAADVIVEAAAPPSVIVSEVLVSAEPDCAIAEAIVPEAVTVSRPEATVIVESAAPVSVIIVPEIAMSVEPVPAIVEAAVPTPVAGVFVEVAGPMSAIVAEIGAGTEPAPAMAESVVTERVAVPAAEGNPEAATVGEEAAPAPAIVPEDVVSTEPAPAMAESVVVTEAVTVPANESASEAATVEADAAPAPVIVPEAVVSTIPTPVKAEAAGPEAVTVPAPETAAEAAAVEAEAAPAPVIVPEAVVITAPADAAAAAEPASFSSSPETSPQAALPAAEPAVVDALPEPVAAPDALHDNLWSAAEMVAEAASAHAPPPPPPPAPLPLASPSPDLVPEPQLAPAPEAKPIPVFMTNLRGVPDSLQWAVFGGTAAFLGVIWVAIWFAVGK